MFDGYRRTYLTIYLAICMNSEQSVLWSLVSMHAFISTSIAIQQRWKKVSAGARTHKQKQTTITKAPKKKPLIHSVY